jgi:hypothetical protein
MMPAFDEGGEPAGTDGLECNECLAREARRVPTGEFWSSQRLWSGRAMLSRYRSPCKSRRKLRTPWRGFEK